MNLPLPVADLLAILYALIALLKGIRRGLSGELGRLIGMVAVAGSAWWFYPAVTDYLLRETRIQGAGQAQLVSLIALLAAGYVLYLCLRLLLKAILDFRFKGKIERVGGGLLGLARAAVVIAVILLVLSLRPGGVLHTHVVEASYTGRFFAAYAIPRYARLADRHPEWSLPYPPVQDTGEAEAPEDEGDHTADRGEESWEE